MIHDNSDARLLREFRKGDVDAFAIFVRRHQDTIYRLALRSLGDPDRAREAAQEVFFRAWQKLGRWRFGRGKPFTWLYRTMKNVCREFKKNMMRQETINQLPHDQTMPIETGSGTETEILEKNHLEQLIRALPARQQEVTVLHIYEDFTLAEVSAVLGIPLGTVKSNYHKALVNLRRGYTDDRSDQ